MHLLDDVVALRRALHRIPELSFHEALTSALLKGQLGALERPPELVPCGGTGFWFDIGPDAPEATILLRADMDGLPITEATGLPYASERHGFMHACGHDAHMAALATAARRLLADPPRRIRVRCLFQPAEEGGGGAIACMRDGVLDGVDMAFGIHVWNELPLGTVAATVGGVMAGVVEFALTVNGQGGHGAMPHQTSDAIVAAAQLVTALQTIASRRIAPVEPVVVTVGSIHGGDAFNVIPPVVTLRGTVRAFSTQAIDTVEHAMREIASGIGQATGTRVEVDYTRHSRPTVNDARAVAVARDALATGWSAAEVLGGYRTMAGEDFGEILHRTPGCFLLVGSGNVELGLTEPHHSPRFELDEGVLEASVGVHLAVVAAVDADPGRVHAGAA